VLNCCQNNKDNIYSRPAKAYGRLGDIRIVSVEEGGVQKLDGEFGATANHLIVFLYTSCHWGKLFYVLSFIYLS